MALTQISTQGIKDGTVTGTDLATNIDLVDSQKIRIGTGNDFLIFHDASTNKNHIQSAVGGRNIQIGSSSYIAAEFVANNGQVQLLFNGDLKLATQSYGVTIQDNLVLFDNDRIKLGNSEDLQIYHDGTNTKFDNSTGKLLINTSANLFGVLHGSDDAIISRVNGAVELYHDNSKKFETRSNGANLIGNLESNSFTATNGDAFIGGDNKKLVLGTGSDLQIYHDGSNSYIDDVGAGNLRIRSNGAAINLQKTNGENLALFGIDGAVELYHDNALKLTTLSSGVQMANGSGNNTLSIFNSDKLSFGNSGELKIFHDGTTSIIKSASHAIAHFSNIRHHFLNGDGSAVQAVFVAGGQCELYHDNSKKFETTSNGALIENIGGDAHLVLKGTNYGVLYRRGSDNQLIGFTGSGGAVNLGTSNLALSAPNSSGNIIFQTAGTSASDERMRINSDGNVFIGTTVVNPGFGNNSDPGNFFAHTGYAMHSRDNGTALFIARNDSTGSLVSFNYNGGGQIADITTNGSTVSYGTGSDYRLKENITNLTNAITRLKKLKPSRFNFLTTPSITQDGFIAHEVQEVVPEAVTGVKDEVRTEDGDMGEKTGDPVMQNLDVAKLVPLLTAGLQEAISKIELLETEVAALKAG